CLCMSNPITIQGEEKKEFYRRLAAGEDMSDYVSPNRVKDVPEGYKKYVEKMHIKMVDAGERGKLGYVWRDNVKYWRSQFSREELERMGLAQPRTKRVKTEEEKADIQARWDERKEQNRLTITTGNNVLRVAEDLQYEDTYRERVQLRRALKDNRLVEVRDITSRLAKQIATINREAAGWTDIPNPHTWLQTFTLSEMQAANSAIQKTFQRWTWNFDTRDSLSFLKGRLEREMRVVESSKYATKDVAKAAFEQRLKLIEKRTEMLNIKESISHELSFASTTRSPIVQKLDDELRALFADNNADLALMRSKASELRKNVARLEAEAARRTKSVASATATSPSATMSDEQIRNEMVKLFRSWGENIDASKITVVDGQVHLSEVQHMVISEHVKVLAAERKQVWSRGWDNGYIQTSNSFKINGALRDVKHDGMFKIIGKDISGNPNLSIAADMYGKTLNADDIKTIATLDRIIGKNSLPFPVRLVRNVGWEGIEPLFGGNIDIQGLTRKEIAAKLSGMKLNKLESDCGFMSTSTNPKNNVFKSRKYQIQIEVPAGKPVYITSNLSESEAVLGRASELILKEVRYNEALDIVEVLVRLA
ncbi:MAG: hypothetical protein IJ640_13585, partial [Prevotella sp.]|nr:hypothetical protein [Prevotella sp.]